MKWQPVLQALCTIVIREAGAYILKRSFNSFHAQWIRNRVREKLSVIRRDFPHETEPKPRDKHGRFTKNDDTDERR